MVSNEDSAVMLLSYVAFKLSYVTAIKILFCDWFLHSGFCILSIHNYLLMTNVMFLYHEKCIDVTLIYLRTAYLYFELLIRLLRLSFLLS